MLPQYLYSSINKCYHNYYQTFIPMKQFFIHWFVVLVLMVSLSQQVQIRQLTTKLNTYDPIQMYRVQVIQANLQKIAKNNQLNHNYQLKQNKFIAMTEAEWTQTYIMKVPLPNNTPPMASALNSNKKNIDIRSRKAMTVLFPPVIIPTIFNELIDHKAKGYVSGVKDQGNCGSCYAFSTTASVESAFLMKNVKIAVSEQQIIDCTTNKYYYNEGCNGGYMINAMIYILNSGISSEQSYPYLESDSSPCQQNPPRSKYFLEGAGVVNNFYDTINFQYQGCQGIYNSLKEQPLAIGVYITADWMFYQSGIFTSCPTAPKGVNHATLLVGYVPKTNNSLAYWVIKNQWGKDWGENGYIKISAATGNPCNLCYYATYAVA